MKRSSSRVSSIILSIALICILLATFPSAVLSNISAGTQFKEIWQRANSVAVCSYQTEIIQTAHPLPLLINAGLTSSSKHIYMQGTVNRPDKHVQMAMWEEQDTPMTASDANSVQHVNDESGFVPWVAPDTSVHIRIDHHTTYGRVGSGTWEALDEKQAANFMFAPGKDMLGYLESATNVRRSEPVVRDGKLMTRYTFDMDGVTFARYASKHIQADMQRRGTLPAGARIKVPDEYVSLSGTGEMWVDDQGNPMHHLVHVAFPHPYNQETVEATVRTTYTNWKHDTRLAWFVLPSLNRDDMQQTSFMLALAALLMAMMAMLVRHWRSRRVYLVVVVSVIGSLLMSPLLQGLQTDAFAREQAMYIEEQYQQQRTDTIVRDVEAQTLAPLMDPHTDPLVINRVLSTSSPLAVNQMHMLAATNDIDEQADTTDTDGDGLTDTEEHVYGTDPKHTDTDGDGLSDRIELKELGTTPLNVDTDEDGISDGVEIRGFETNEQSEYALKKWYLNPLEADTNRDGLADGVECVELVDVGFDVDQQRNVIQRTIAPATSCASVSKNDWTGDDEDSVYYGRNSSRPDMMIPYAWLDDNDQDGVPDSMDDSPMSGYQIAGSTLSFQLSQVTPGTSTFVDFQFRPKNQNHLRFSLPVFDWPSNDRSGQVQRVKNTTFRDLNGDSTPSAPKDSNGDMRLVPMLEIEIPYEQGSAGSLPTKCNAAAGACPQIAPSASSTDTDQRMFTWLDSWLDREEMQKYGISVRPKDKTGTLIAYLPVNLIYDDKTNEPVAFAARMYYRPNSSSFGKAQNIRLAWLVQAMTDQCSPPPEWFESSLEDSVRSEKWCANPNNWETGTTVVHTYYDDWNLTSLSVREDHGGTMGTIVQPSTTDQVYQSSLWNVARGLEKSFIAGRRDMTVAEIQRRFDPTLNATTSDTERWGFPRDTFAMRVERYVDETEVARYPLQYTQEILTKHVAGASLASMLFVQEESFRQASLDMDKSVIQTIIQPKGISSLNVVLDPKAVVLDTKASMKLATFEYDGVNWNAASLDTFEQRFDSLFQDMLRQRTSNRDVLAGQIAYLKSFFIALSVGVQRSSAITAHDDTMVRQAIQGKDAAIDLIDTFEPDTVLDKTSYFAYIGSLGQNGLTTNLVGSKKTRTVANASPSGLSIGIQSALNTYQQVQGPTQVTIPVNAQSQTGSTPWMRLGVKGTLGLYSTYSAIKDLKSIKKLTSVTKLSKNFLTATKTAKQVASSARKMSVLGAVVSVGISMGSFFYMWGSGAIQPGTPAFKMALATMIAEIIVTIILLVIELMVPIGPIITAIIAVVDAIIGAICGALGVNESDNETAKFFCSGIAGMVIKALVRIFYDYTVIVDMGHEDRLDMNGYDQRLVNPAMGFMQGNSFEYSFNVDSKLFPAKDAASLFVRHATSSTFLYEITRGEEEDDQQIHKRRNPGLAEMEDQWKPVRDTLSFQSTTRVRTILNFTGPGVNWSSDVPLFLAEGSATPGQECILLAFCDIEEESSSLYVSLGSAVSVYDVFPSTVDEFYSLEFGGNYVKFDWDGKFNVLVDGDGDGLRAKYYGGIDPDDGTWDTDGDGWSDFYEVQHTAQGFDPITKTDNDGIPDRVEVAFGTDPNKLDSDYDGLTDKEEILGWLYVYDYAADGTPVQTMVTSDPLNPDTDHDGMYDSREATFGTSPRVWTDQQFFVIDYGLIEDEKDFRGNPRKTDGIVRPGWPVYSVVTVTNKLRNRNGHFYAHTFFGSSGVSDGDVLPRKTTTSTNIAYAPYIYPSQPVSITTAVNINIPFTDKDKNATVPSYANYQTSNRAYFSPGTPILAISFDELEGSTSFTNRKWSRRSTIQDPSEPTLSSRTCSGTSCPIAGTTGQIFHAPLFDGQDDRIEWDMRGDYIPIAQNASFAVALSVFPDQTTTTQTVVELNRQDGGEQPVFRAYLDTERRPMWRNETTTFQWDTSLPKGVWSHLTFVEQATTTTEPVIAYLNGERIPAPCQSTDGTSCLPQHRGQALHLPDGSVQADTDTNTDTDAPRLSADSYMLRVGNDARSTSPYKGKLDELYLWVNNPPVEKEIRGLQAYQNAWNGYSKMHTVIVDVEKPIVDMVFDGHYAPKKEIVIPIVVSDEIGLATVEYSVDNGATWQTPTLDEGVWMFTYQPQSEGRKFFRVRAFDHVDNSSVEQGSFIVDNTPPVVQFDHNGNIVPRPLTAIANTGTWTVTLSGSVLENRPNDSGLRQMTVSLFDANGGPIGEPQIVTAVAADGRWSVDYPVTEPVNEMCNMVIESIDNVGNTIENKFTVALEMTAPFADVAIASTIRDSEGNLFTNVLAGTGTNLPIMQGTITEQDIPPHQELLMHFEEQAGAVIFRDSSSAQRAGECSGTACPQMVSTDTYGKARSFDGNDIVTISQGATYRQTDQLLQSNPNAYPQAPRLPNEEITIAAWVSPNAQSQRDGFVSALYSVGGSDKGWMLGSRSGRFTFGLASADADDGDGFMTYLEVPEAYTPGQWYHVAATYDGSMMRIYVNGELKESSDVQSGTILYPDSAWFGIGAYNDGDEVYGYTGLLDEMMIYRRALSSDEIATIGRPVPVLSGINTLEIALQHKKDRMADIPLVWQTVPLNVTSQQRFLSWSYPIPAGLEGPYVFSLRVTDKAGNMREIPRVWDGIIDTRAPRLTFTSKTDATGTRYTTVAEDFNISDNDLSSPCGKGVITQSDMNDEAWFTGVFSVVDTSGTQIRTLERLYRTTAECQFGATDPVLEVAALEMQKNEQGNYAVVLGNLAYVETTFGFNIVDITDVQSPQVIARYKAPTRGGVVAMAATGTYVYLGYALGGMDVIDVSVPTRPQLVGSTTIRATMQSIIVDGSYAYALDTTNRFQIIAVNDPTKPTRVGYYQVQSAASLVRITSTRAYIADTTSLSVLDITTPANVALVASYALPAGIKNVAFDGTFVYGIVGDTFVLYDSASSVAPSLKHIGSYVRAGLSNVFGRAVAGSSVYLVDNSSIIVLDVSVPSKPALRSIYKVPETIRSVTINNGLLYASTWDHVRIYDIDNTLNSVQASACDIFGNCASGSEPLPTALSTMLASHHSMPASLQQATTIGINVAPVPSLLAVTEPVVFTVGVNAPNGLKDVSITIDGTPLLAQSWPSSSALTETVLTISAWTPTDEGLHTLVVQATDQTNAIARDDKTTLVLDTHLPAASLTKTTINGQDYTPENDTFALRGTVSDVASIADVQLTIATAQGNEELPVTLTDSNGREMRLPVAFPHASGAPSSLNWQANWSSQGAIPDGMAATLTLLVTDMAGHQITTQQPVLIDGTNPTLGTVTPGYRTAGGTTIITPGMTVSAVYEPELVITWDAASDLGSIDHYLAGWTTSPDPVPSDLTSYPAGASSHTQKSGDMQRRYAHLIAVDRAGNQNTTTSGPIYVDYGPTPSYIAMNEPGRMLPYQSWADSSCSLVGQDNRIFDHTNRFATLNEQQQFSTTWNDQTLRMMWRGADWDLNGDLFIYMDTTTGGSPYLYDPFPASITNTLILLPPSNTAASASLAQHDQAASIQATSPRPAVRPHLSATSGPMGADALIWVQNSITATLLLWDGTAWKPAPGNNGLEYIFDTSQAVPTTDLAVSFTALGINNPADTTLSLLAVASEPDVLRLWSTMPPRNNLNSSSIVDSNGTSSIQMFALTKSYTWKLATGVCPGVVATPAQLQAGDATLGAPTGADVRASISSFPSGVAYSLLNDNLFFAMKDMAQFAGVDWDTSLSRLCAMNPDDPACRRTPEPKPALNASTASVRVAALAPTNSGDGPFLTSQSTLDTVKDTYTPPLGDGNLVIYTIELANEGSVASRDVKADVYTWGGIRLPSGDHRTDASGEYDVRTLDVGDLDPGERVRVDFPAVVDTTFDPQNQHSKASIDVTVYDATGQHAQLIDGTDVYTNELERLFVEHELDTSPPDYIEISSPTGILAPGQNTIYGFVYDRSAVPQIDIEVRQPGGTTRSVNCTDTTPHDSTWECVIETGAALTGDTVDLRVRAVDTYGAVGAWSAWTRSIVDATPPTVHLDEQSQNALVDGILGYNDAILRGTISDNDQVREVTVCTVVNGEEQCEPATLRPSKDTQTVFRYEDIPTTPVAIGANTSCSTPLERTFVVTDTFTVERVSFGLNISHTLRGDLNVALQSPAGTKVMMLYDGTNASNYDVLIDDASPTLDRDDTIDHNVEPTYYENQRGGYSLLRAFKGQPATGTWKLSICDTFPASDTGTYNHSMLVLEAPTTPVSTTVQWEYTLPIADPDAQDARSISGSQPSSDLSVVFLPFVGKDGGKETVQAPSPSPAPETVLAPSLQSATPQHTLSIYGTDARGNRTAAPLRIAYNEDTTMPEVSLTSSSAFTLTMSEVVTGSDKLRMSGTVSDTSGIKAMRLIVTAPTMAFYQDTIIPNGTTWEYANAYLFLEPGTYQWMVEATDVADTTQVIGPYTLTVLEATGSPPGGAARTSQSVESGNENNRYVIESNQERKENEQ